MTQIVCECKEKEEDFPGGPGDTNPPVHAGAGDSSRVWEDSACRGASKVPEPQLPSP